MDIEEERKESVRQFLQEIREMIDNSIDVSKMSEDDIEKEKVKKEIKFTKKKVFLILAEKITRD